MVEVQIRIFLMDKFEEQVRILLKDKQLKLCQNTNTANHTLIKEKILLGFSILQKQLDNQGIFLIRSKFSVTAYLFLALYGSTTLQSRSFLRNIKNFLCKQKIVNNYSIHSMHAERKITVRSHKHSFTPYPSLSPYRRTESQTEKQIHSLHMGWRNPFLKQQKNVSSSPRAASVLIWQLTFNVPLCQIYCCGEKLFLVLLKNLE